MTDENKEHAQSNQSEQILVPVIENLTESDKTSHKKITKALKGKKKLMVEALRARLGVVSQAAEEAKISRETHYNWINNDPVYKKAVQEVNEHLKDVIESSFLSLIIEKNPQAVIHAVKTKLKERGYGEEPIINNQQSNYTFKIERPQVKNENTRTI